ncbi:wax ester/triacylglycerol synthase family O-acyltransferase [Gordonia sp. TBRC 11910]|uniref:Diacylglycerol O-acyltransferase n=1 Tax=Gordonia asplenii TaxID=2725283 RepID=A0A848KL75_9ACTN|nr:wax ester/triacylglycerol synthase family O-acyltransferase [Gordonia asplenii]NMN99853.1 wax ester/triacylglycerol synthase family O-acyltransferase [Gordonia asplenii]
MRKLTGLDASFLHLETGPVYGHVSSLGIYDPSTAPEPLTAATVRARLLARMHKMEIFRKRLVEVPMNLDHPYWVDDPDFNIDDHVYDVGLAAPGSREQLIDVVSRIVAKPLDRSRPLWEMAIIGGLDDGMVAVLTTVHHSAIDGVSGADILGIMLDVDPSVDQPTPAPQPWKPESQPAQLSLFASAVTANAVRPVKAAQLQWDLFTHYAKRPGNVKALFGQQSMRIPRTPFNIKPTNRRVFAPFQIPLSEVKEIRKGLGATVNDVVMAICAGGLRTWLSEHDALPDKPLKAGVPVSTRDESQRGALGNQVSLVLADLPTNLDDPLARLKAVHESMNAAKEMHNALPVATIIGFSDFAVPAITAGAARALQRSNLTSTVIPSNVAISNVPGPQVPIYLNGAKLVEFYPVSMLADGQALNITLHSYNGSLFFGLISSPNAVPDIAHLADLLLAEHQALLAAARQG